MMEEFYEKYVNPYIRLTEGCTTMFDWGTAIYQLVFLTLILFFFYGLFRFVSRNIRHRSNTAEALRRIEEKLDLILRKEQD